jgi:transcriptional regulator with XRE-family HTH domain
MPDVYHTIAERIDAGCRALNLKQRELAENAGLPSRQLLTQIKTGSTPGRRYIPALAGALACSVEWLTTGTGQAPSWAAPRPAQLAREAGQAYDAPVEAPPWATRLIAEVQALRAEVAELRAKPSSLAPVDTTTPLPSVARDEARRRIRHGRAQTERDHAPLPRPVVLEDDEAVSTELDRLLDPDEYPRPEAPTYPRPDSVPDGTPHGS